jgi:hypothetical protein
LIEEANIGCIFLTCLFSYLDKIWHYRSTFPWIHQDTIDPRTVVWGDYIHVIAPSRQTHTIYYMAPNAASYPNYHELQKIVQIDR